MIGARVYPAPHEREIDVEALAILPEEEADAGENDGLQGNQQYRDLRGISWEQVADGLRAEAALFQRFEASEDIDAEAERYEEERDEALLPEEDLWGLDVGVIGATLALPDHRATLQHRDCPRVQRLDRRQCEAWSLGRIPGDATRADRFQPQAP